MRHVFPMKLYGSMAIFAAKFRRAFSQGVPNRHGYPPPFFDAVCFEKFFDFTLVDLFFRFQGSLRMARVCLRFPSIIAELNLGGTMNVTGWNNGQWNITGAGYGVRIAKRDREKHFKRQWASVIVKIQGCEPVRIRLSEAFWKDCIELRSQGIGGWMIARGFSSWPSHKPPHFSLVPTGDNAFELV